MIMIPNLGRLRWAVMAMLILVFIDFGWNASAGSREKGKAETGSAARAGGDSNMGLSGEELWSMNCRRCHNIQPATMYSDAQWDVIVHHMRVRANLTGADQRAIIEFLKSSH
jgi:hypothetical protein